MKTPSSLNLLPWRERHHRLLNQRCVLHLAVAAGSGLLLLAMRRALAAEPAPLLPGRAPA